MQTTYTASWAGFVPKKQTMRPPPVLRDGVVKFFFKQNPRPELNPKTSLKKTTLWLCPHTQAPHMFGSKNPSYVPNWPSKTGNPSGSNRDNNPPKPSAPPLPPLAPASVQSRSTAPRGPIPPYGKK